MSPTMPPRDIKTEECLRTARKAGAFYECPDHPGVLLSSGKWSSAADGAEEIGVVWFKEGRLRGGFKTPGEYIKELRSLIEDTPRECPECATCTSYPPLIANPTIVVAPPPTYTFRVRFLRGLRVFILVRADSVDGFKHSCDCSAPDFLDN